ncbi:MAG: DUF3737 family protein [Clostridiales bacterium]|nr:DUF3737 family protein [Clostridiales bacterium]
MERKTVRGKTFDEERALYHAVDMDVVECNFEGPQDGESALKESSDIVVRDCTFSLRYPFWHVTRFSIDRITMNETCRAPIWYAKEGTLSNCEIKGVKAIRECKDIKISNCTIDSPEFGWKCEGLRLENVTLNSEYIFFESRHLHLENVTMKGKYSFQYVEGGYMKNCDFDTKDAFWHCKDLTIKNCTIKGEYLGWYSDGLTLKNCRIIGTQPLCYCKNLKLINCTMEECDLSFEYSDVEAEITGRINSVKNPRSGKIVCDEVGEIIRGDEVMPCSGEVVIRKKG